MDSAELALLDFGVRSINGLMNGLLEARPITGKIDSSAPGNEDGDTLRRFR
jgi:hypothetical protein